MRFPLMKNNIQRDDLDAVIEHLKADDPRLTHGEQVREFEREWSEWLGVKYSVMINSGASANLLSMAILKIRHPEGGEVIVPPFTWISDIASVLQNGFTPVFVDVDHSTLAMNPQGIIEAITDKTRAVFITHAQGIDALTDELIAELDARNIPLIEDVCESHGASHNGKLLGSIGWISNFSFYYAHHLSTIEGGMICTNDFDVYQQARMLRSHGMVREASDAQLREQYEADYPDLNSSFIFSYQAYNVRPNELGGIIGRSQLKRLDENNAQRQANWERFLNNIDSSIFFTDFKLEGGSNYAFNMILNHPSEALAQKLMVIMDENGIEYRRGSVGGGNQLRQPYLRGIVHEGYHTQFPQTEHLHFFAFYIGNYPGMTTDEVDEICQILNTVVATEEAQAVLGVLESV